MPERPWTWLRQVHGARVVTVTELGEWAGTSADAAVTAVAGAALVVRTADCAPVVLLADGVVGVAHAGWRGLLAGVLEATVAAMRALQGEPIRAVVGPTVGPECYEFGAGDLPLMVDRFGPGVEGRTSEGRPAFDLPAAVAVVLAELGVELTGADASCTACAPERWYSFRARGEAARMATFGWLEG